MDGYGLPLAFSMTPDQPTLKPLEKRILKDFNMSKFIVCTDAGFSSHGNRLYNTYGKRAFVTTQSIKKLKRFLEEWALDPKEWRLPGRKQEINLDDIRHLENDRRTYYKERWIKENDLEQKLIATYSPVYKRYQSSIWGKSNRSSRQKDRESGCFE